MPDSVPASPYSSYICPPDVVPGDAFLYKKKAPRCGVFFVNVLLDPSQQIGPKDPCLLSTSYFLLDKSFCVEGDEEFFVCCNDDSLRSSVLRDEVVGFLAALEVAFFVNLVTEDF